MSLIKVAYFGIKTKLECFTGSLPFSVPHYGSGGKFRKVYKTMYGCYQNPFLIS